MGRKEDFYNRKLNKYFESHYPGRDMDAEWYVNPKPNAWMFELDGERHTLVCDENGNVHEIE